MGRQTDRNFKPEGTFYRTQSKAEHKKKTAPVVIALSSDILVKHENSKITVRPQRNLYGYVNTNKTDTTDSTRYLKTIIEERNVVGKSKTKAGGGIFVPVLLPSVFKELSSDGRLHEIMQDLKNRVIVLKIDKTFEPKFKAYTKMLVEKYKESGLFIGKTQDAINMAEATILNLPLVVSEYFNNAEKLEAVNRAFFESLATAQSREDRNVFHEYFSQCQIYPEPAKDNTTSTQVITPRSLLKLKCSPKGKQSSTANNLPKINLIMLTYDTKTEIKSLCQNKTKNITPPKITATLSTNPVLYK